jgi:hypothetical protein
MNIFDALRNHDYYYEYSDDHSVWSRGNASEGAIIRELAKLIPSQALLLIERNVPKKYHEAWAYRVTTERKVKNVQL